MWIKAESNVEPLEIDDTSSKKFVYVRKNIVFVGAEEERDAHYEYEEQKVNKDDWDIYKLIMSHDTQLTDTELAIVELYEMIS